MLSLSLDNLCHSISIQKYLLQPIVAMQVVQNFCLRVVLCYVLILKWNEFSYRANNASENRDDTVDSGSENISLFDRVPKTANPVANRAYYP